MESFLLVYSASEVPDVVEPVETVNKRPTNLYLFILNSSTLIEGFLFIFIFSGTNNIHFVTFLL